MAIVWYVFHGPNPTRGEAGHIMAFDECVNRLGLAKEHWIREELLSGPFRTPKFGSENDKLALFREPKHVVIEVGEGEAKVNGWEPGYYQLRLSPAEAKALIDPS